MGLAVRIIPSLLVRGKQLIKGERFNSWRSVGVAEQAVRIHQMRGVDELLLLDIAATPENRCVDMGLLSDLADCCFMPLAVGGGVRSVEDVRDLLRHGADKVVIGTAAVETPDLVRRVADAFGSATIVVSMDVKDGWLMSQCGARKELVASLESAAQVMEEAGAGEILLTAIDREGTMQGYDLDLIREVSQAVSIPVIANGGCRDYADMEAAIKAGASAVSAGALFQFTDATPRGAAEYLHQRGVEVRV